MPIKSSLTSRVRFALAATVAMSALYAPAASAEDDGPVSLSANVAFATEYRFRGLSLSDHDPALQGGLDVSTKSGFYVGTWGSSIQPYGGSELEMDIYGGYKHDWNGITSDIGVLAYTYPGSKHTHYIEGYGSFSGTAGIVNWKVGAAYVWSQANTGNQDNIYLYLNGDAPIADTPFSIAGHIAYENGAFADKKWDWSMGVAYAYKQYTLSLSYVDTNLNDATTDGIGKATVVGMLSASF
ncbi:TorF family putative porin [Kordiimonas marina]|uniref:TorF family putative porin n=1 Tax=Kordiimonas marina TaxID=2872312 RepID=UPI001FF18B98|nr:TorF family putative porin [Kordiimonas marina]MCJ9427670.1 TorF family putative porin [Kordiimonas marina]